ncbi:MAG: Mur ligase family protein [bacterium]|nr:Mur ligase family protein [bacterium]
MKLYRLLERMEYSVLAGNADLTISTIEHDSTKVVKDSVFVCINGNKIDGHDLVNAAIARGATAIISERQIFVPDHITVILVGNTKIALSYMAAAYYGYPAEQLKTVGITGTKGKSTTCCMVQSLLSAGGIKTGVIDEKQVLPARQELDSLLLHKQLRDMVTEGYEAVVIEVSSKACKQYKMAGISFDYGVLTNIAREHIGPNEHGSFEEYIECKAQLFRQCRIGIVNADCEKLPEIMKNHSCRVETYGRRQNALLYAYQPVLMEKTGYLGNQFYVGGIMCSCFELWMPGLFNIYNALASILVARHFMITEETMKRTFDNLVIKGCQEAVVLSPNYTVIVDSSNDLRSVTELISAVKAYVPRRLVCIYNCDQAINRVHRYAIGRTLAMNADEIVITTDHKEDQILEEISLGITDYGGTPKNILHSIEAISHTILNAKAKDIILYIGNKIEINQEKLVTL